MRMAAESTAVAAKVASVDLVLTSIRILFFERRREESFLEVPREQKGAWIRPGGLVRWSVMDYATSRISRYCVYDSR
jgi:hypothetical protein